MSQTQTSELKEQATFRSSATGWPMWLGMLVRMVIFAFCLGNIAMFGKAMLHFAYTSDLPWILQSGAWILDHHRLPTHDIFSWTYPEKPWVLYQWLFEVIVALGWRLLGDESLIRLFTVLVLALYVGLPLWRSRRQNIPLVFSLGVASMALFLAAVNISLRPMVVTSLFLALQYLLLERYRRKAIALPSLLMAVTVIHVLWANMHTGVVMGLLSIGLFLVGDALEMARVCRAEAKNQTVCPRCPGAYALLLMATLGGSLVNPYGVGIYTYLFDLSSQQYLNNAIIELQSPNFHVLNFVYFAAFLVILMAVFLRLRQTLSAQAMLHVLVFTLLTLVVHRFVVWTALFYALIFPETLYRLWLQAKAPFKSLVQGFEIYRPLLWVLLPGVVVVFLFFPKAVQPLKLYMPVQYGNCEPLRSGIQAYGRLHRPGDRLLNDPEIGSCLIGQFPQYKVFIDTRFDFYAQDFARESRLQMSLMEDWQAYLKQWRIETVMLSRKWPLYFAIKNQSGFETLYEDPAMGIFRKQEETHE